jgi:aryl-alcohol dehydrogenase-like predicted oxidoreductase
MIEKIPFGRTGHQSTRILFGGAAFLVATQADADRTLDVLLEYGINHIDAAAAASYGEAELRIGPWMRKHREDFFLATKTEKRTYREARDELHRSLDLLQVDQVDLWQMHLLVDPAEWETAMNEGGVLEAFIEAREQGLVRFLGVTGHGWTTPQMHLKSLDRFDFDTVLLPYNYFMMQNPDYAGAFGQLLARCKEKNVAFQTIKALAVRPWGPQERGKSTTWYRPLKEQADIDLAVSYVLAQPDIFLNAVADINLLPRVLDAASRQLPPPEEDDLKALAQRQEMADIFN